MVLKLCRFLRICYQNSKLLCQATGITCQYHLDRVVFVIISILNFHAYIYVCISNFFLHTFAILILKPNDVSFFEMTIRYLGGLLALYSLTNDEVFLSTALSLGNKLLPVFQHESNPGLPLPYINLQTGV